MSRDNELGMHHVHCPNCEWERFIPIGAVAHITVFWNHNRQWCTHRIETVSTKDLPDAS